LHTSKLAYEWAPKTSWNSRIKLSSSVAQSCINNRGLKKFIRNRAL